MATATTPTRRKKTRLRPDTSKPKPRTADAPDETVSAETGRIDRVETLHMMSPACLVDHPANPHDRVLPPAVADLTASIDEFGQRDPVRVRVIDENKAQILSGHRRVAACRVLGRDVRCELVVCNDAEALREVMLGNAERSDLDPVERGELLRVMIDSGIDRDEAGRLFGLSSESGIKNALRIARLPDSIKKLLRDGTIPARCARYLIPYIAMPKALDEFAEELTDKYGDQLGYFLKNPRESVAHLVRVDGTLNGYARKPNARPIDGSAYELSWQHENATCGFLVNNELRKKLKVVEVPVDGKMTEVATNVKLFDKLNEPYVKKKKAHGGSGAAKKKASKKKKVELTPAQVKAEEARKRKEAAMRLKNSLPVWSIRFQRCFLSFCTPLGSPVIESTLPWIVTMITSNTTWVTRGAETEIGKIKGSSSWNVNHENTALALMTSPGIGDRIWRVILWPQHRPGWERSERIDEELPADIPLNPRQSAAFPKLWPAMLDAAELSIEDAWEQSRVDGHPLHDLVREYLSLHNAEQLGSVAKAAKVKLVATAKGKIVDELLETHVAKGLPMPAVLKPAKRKTAARKTARRAK